MNINNSTYPYHFLIIRLSAIGDIVMASGLINSLKSTYPNCKISWMAEPIGATLLNQDDRLEEVVVFDKSKFSSYLKSKQYRLAFGYFKDVAKRLRATKYDCVIDTQGLFKSAIWAKVARKNHSVGFKSKEKSHWFVKQSLSKQLSNQISSEYRQLAQYLNCDQNSFQLKLKVNATTEERVNDLTRGLIGNQAFICFAPFTTRPQKHWIEQYWSDLVQLIQNECSLPIVVLGGPNDENKVERIFSGTQVISLCGKTSLLEASHLISKAKLFVGVDTGLTHMAVMGNIPCLAIFGSTCPYTVTDNPHCEVLYKDLKCAPCKRKPTCNARFDCMRELAPEYVFERASVYLNQQSRTEL